MPDDTPPLDLRRIVQTAPVCLRERPQWVCWKFITRNGKPTKCPIKARGGGKASTVDSSTWASFDDAISACQRQRDLAGVGFVFAADDPYTGIDLDECLDGEGHLASGAQTVVDLLASYTEVSPSGRGCKIIVEGRKPADAACRSKVFEDFKEVEIYSQGRFFTLTGNHLSGTPRTVEPRQAELDQLCTRLWPKNGRSQRKAGSPAHEPPDDALVERACAAQNGGLFRRLWDGDTSAHGGDDSAADMALYYYP